MNKLVLVVLLLIPISLSAQKKQISQAQEIIKSGKNLDKAEAMMRKLLRDSLYKENPKVWNTLALSLQKQYEQANEKLFLKQAYDTTALFQVTKRWFMAAESLDSIDARPNSKGVSQPRYRRENADMLGKIRPNLYYGGTYYLANKKYQEAIGFYDLYLDCARQPLFSSYDYAERDTLRAQAAYWAMTAGTKLSDADKVLSYLPIARKDSTLLDRVLSYAAMAYLQKKDTTSYTSVLAEGFEKFPLSSFFFPRLMDYYERHDMEDQAKEIVDKALVVDSTNVLFLYAKSTVLLNMGRYDECISVCQQLLCLSDTVADTYYNLGIAYFNKAIMKEKRLMKQTVKSSERRKEKAEIKSLFEASCPYLEKFRALAPEKIPMWSGPLYTIYLHLNKGIEFEEIEKIRNEYRKNLR